MNTTLQRMRQTVGATDGVNNNEFVKIRHGGKRREGDFQYCKTGGMNEINNAQPTSV